MARQETDDIQRTIAEMCMRIQFLQVMSFNFALYTPKHRQNEPVSTELYSPEVRSLIWLENKLIYITWITGIGR